MNPAAYFVVGAPYTHANDVSSTTASEASEASHAWKGKHVPVQTSIKYSPPSLTRVEVARLVRRSASQLPWHFNPQACLLIAYWSSDGIVFKSDVLFISNYKSSFVSTFSPIHVQVSISRYSWLKFETTNGLDGHIIPYHTIQTSFIPIKKRHPCHMISTTIDRHLSSTAVGRLVYGTKHTTDKYRKVQVETMHIIHLHDTFEPQPRGGTRWCKLKQHKVMMCISQQQYYHSAITPRPT